MIMLKVKFPDENMVFKMMANIATLMESSIAVEAKINVGIPFETP